MLFPGHLFQGTLFPVTPVLVVSPKPLGWSKNAGHNQRRQPRVCGEMTASYPTWCQIFLRLKWFRHSGLPGVLRRFETALRPIYSRSNPRDIMGREVTIHPKISVKTMKKGLILAITLQKSLKRVIKRVISTLYKGFNFLKWSSQGSNMLFSLLLYSGSISLKNPSKRRVKNSPSAWLPFFPTKGVGHSEILVQA
jgi:hypothetical protein